MPQLLRVGHGDLILRGDFNCVTDPTNTNGTFQNSRALTEMIRGLSLTNTWKKYPTRPTFTHHSSTGASRIDRVYVFRDMMHKKTGIEIVPAAFTDHNAVVLRLVLGELVARRG
jgi:endonuclease/exonuclease/phosphatase family metal-dependent hydrolase